MNSLDNFDSIPVIGYPAPLLKFSKAINDLLVSGLKASLMTVYSEFIRECASFYAPMCSSELSKAKKSLENIGKTIIERYPILYTDGPKAWSFFNQRLSKALRNKRCRIAGKLASGSESTAKNPVPKICVNIKSNKLLGKDEYDSMNLKLKAEFSRQMPDNGLVKELLNATLVNRRDWIDKSKSTEIRLTAIIEKFPCFTNSSYLLHELSLITG